ncbi:MAG: lipocalin family protein [Bryobacteraceae bacterium]
MSLGSLTLLISLVAVGIALPSLAGEGKPPLPVVPSVDLERYAGKWYEIARLPNRFQRGCTGNVTATYTLRPDGKIQVLNQCRDERGRTKSARGTAHPAGKGEPNTKLKVTFFWPFSGDYWIIDLDPGYRWAVVGEPRRRYLWILSREPHLDDETYQGIVERAAAKGFDNNRLIRTAQSP